LFLSETSSESAPEQGRDFFASPLICRLLTKGQAWVGRRAARFEPKRTKFKLAGMKSKALAKGLKLKPIAEVFSPAPSAST
jgi:hypothetical protein